MRTSGLQTVLEDDVFSSVNVEGQDLEKWKQSAHLVQLFLAYLLHFFNAEYHQPSNPQLDGSGFR